jgi:hypothetical protein
VRTRAKLTVAVTAVAVAVSVAGSVAAMAAINGPQPPAAKSSARAAAAAPIDTSTEAKYTAITPCRIVDTRLGGGALTGGSPRSFVAASSTSLAAQGGNAAGCGIPAAAVAIQANVVAVAGTGSGYLKVYPFGATVPTASYLNFRDGKAIANGGAITLDTSGAKHFTVLASRTTHVVIDVSGYSVKPMWALVEGDGTLIYGSRVTSTSSSRTGVYNVVFDLDVSGCAYGVTPSADTPPADTLLARAQPLSGTPDGVFVYFQNGSQTPLDAEFYLTVTC